MAGAATEAKLRRPLAPGPPCQGSASGSGHSSRSAAPPPRLTPSTIRFVGWNPVAPLSSAPPSRPAAGERRATFSPGPLLMCAWRT